MTETLAGIKVIVRVVMFLVMVLYWVRYNKAAADGRAGDQLDALGWMIFCAVVVYA